MCSPRNGKSRTHAASENTRRTHTDTQVYTRVRVRVCTIRTYTHTHTRSCFHAHTHTHGRTQTPLLMFSYTHAQQQTHTHTHTNQTSPYGTKMFLSTFFCPSFLSREIFSQSISCVPSFVLVFFFCLPGDVHRQRRLHYLHHQKLPPAASPPPPPLRTLTQPSVPAQVRTQVKADVSSGKYSLVFLCVPSQRFPV